MQVGDIVMKTSAWSDGRAKELGKTGVVQRYYQIDGFACSGRADS